MTEFDFRFECDVQMLTHLAHNIRKTVVSEFAVKIEYLRHMIMGSETLYKPNM